LLPSDPNYAIDGGEVYLNANGATLSGSGVLRTDTAAVTPGACIIGAFKIGNTVYSTGSTYAVYNNANGWQFDGVHIYHTERGFYIGHTGVVLNRLRLEDISSFPIYSTQTFVINGLIAENCPSQLRFHGENPVINNGTLNNCRIYADVGSPVINNTISINVGYADAAI
jgi:hypothetical protein